MIDDDGNMHSSAKIPGRLHFEENSWRLSSAKGIQTMLVLVHSSRTDRPETPLGRLRVPTSHSGHTFNEVVRNDVAVEYFPTSRKYRQQANTLSLSAFMALGLQPDILQQPRDKNCALRANRDWVEPGVARPIFATCSAPDPQTLARLDDDLEL
jgi:hypothetical protein